MRRTGSGVRPSADLVVVGEKVLAVRKCDPAQADGGGAASGQIPDHGNAIPRFERVFGPSVFGHLAWGWSFANPSLHRAAASFDVEDDLGMRIGPLEFDKCALQLALVVAIVRGIGVVSEDGGRQVQ